MPSASLRTLVLAEKPSVARDIAQVLGARERREGYIVGERHVVTWAIGHLVGLAEPAEMDPRWKSWRMELLPMVPPEWSLVVGKETRPQFEIVKKLLRSREIGDVVCATDAGREGELIFRYIYEAAGATKPVKRLWISSLTPDAIARGFSSLRPGQAFEPLADAARARSRADWLVGMNLSRAYSLVADDHLSVGRVQTPTLAMIVERELEIRSFVPEDYFELRASFAVDDERRYEGVYVRPNVKGPEARRLPKDGEEAERLRERAQRGDATIVKVGRDIRRTPPPLLYDLTELQRHANRLYGFTAQRTLAIAQSLYEKWKLLSYPRTDSRHLSTTVEAALPDVVRTIAPRYAALLPAAVTAFQSGQALAALGPRFVDDAKVTDHHAILPTDASPPESLPADERKIYDLVCRRLLAAWHDEYVQAVTTVVTEIVADGTADAYVSTGTSIEQPGWKVIDVGGARVIGPTLPGGLKPGMPATVEKTELVPKKTLPPPHYSDATLLTAMETAGRKLEEKELSDAMKARGLGTPATRAAILETLLKREYVVRDGKVLSATEKGIALVERVHPHVKSPAMTGEWEAKLARIEKREGGLDAFMKDIEGYVREVLGTVGPASASVPVPMPGSGSGSGSASGSAAASASSARPRRSSDLRVLLRDAFRLESFRPHQEAVCRAVADGDDVLLVMPTGAGKSLCYQLPGIARGGTTLVISPLVALMEDQVAKLQELGFAAARIHAGRDRLESRAVCKQYLDGELDFLFIAPERLRVRGFPEMLGRRRPSLVAIDEAHCISQWGHDFRPDYRLLGERLPLLMPAPIVALTATATPAVQDDIAAQLRMKSPRHFIHGFRRDNIAVEVVERNPSARTAIVQRVLADPARRPAIVYAPTRKDAVAVADALGGPIRAAAYHAGLRPEVRDRVQVAFQSGRLDVVVATIAFGMGIDKADVRTVFHTALPASVEGYYQEIGRAGRDGLPSRAILLHAYSDTKTHEFFLERDYPAPETLTKVMKALAKGPLPFPDLARRAKVKQEMLEKVVEKLAIHAGVRVDQDGMVHPGDATRDFLGAYAKQRAHKEDQLQRMRRFAESATCRMLSLVRHFGDQHDSGKPCGLCDVCAPGACVAQSSREPTREERAIAERVVAALRAREDGPNPTVGQLQIELGVERSQLGTILAGLQRAAVLALDEASFEKDGKTIHFQRVRLRDPDGLSELKLEDRPEPEPKKSWRGFRRRRGSGKATKKRSKRTRR